jgi:hypothetical protein
MPRSERDVTLYGAEVYTSLKAYIQTPFSVMLRVKLCLE